MALPLSTKPPCGVVNPLANCVDVCWAIARLLPALRIIVITKARLKSRAANVTTALLRTKDVIRSFSLVFSCGATACLGSHQDGSKGNAHTLPRPDVALAYDFKELGTCC